MKVLRRVTKVIGYETDGTMYEELVDDCDLIPLTEITRLREVEAELAREQEKSTQLMIAVDKASNIIVHRDKLRVALEVVRKFIDQSEAGYAGMFGHQEVLPKDHAYEWFESYIENILKPEINKALGAKE